MADKSITGLTAASTLDGTELAVVTQGGNSRKVTATKVLSEVTHSATGKTTPVDNDELPLVDSAASNVLKKLLWSNVKATLKTYFDTLYAATGGSFTAASTTEVLTGTDSAKGVTPDALAALWEKGADEASGGTVSFGEGGYFHVTGTSTITDLDWDTAKDGRLAWVIFDGILTLTHNSTTLKLPGAASITTAAGDRALFVQDNSDNVICLAYIKADGTPIAGSFVTASTTEVLTGTDTSKAVTSDALAALWEKGADVASSGTISLGEGGYFHITGTTTITDIDWATAKDGRHALLIFDGALTLTHNATTLKLPGGANITTAAGDRALVVQDASDNVICILYVRADGTPLLSTILRSDTTANMTKGFTASGYNAGTKSAGTFTPDPANGNLQYAVNGGAHTLAPPSTGGGDALTMVIQYTNNGSAGALTTSGFTKKTGDALTTVNGDDFFFHITVLNGFSHLNVVALQ